MAKPKGANPVYTLEVKLLNGPISEEFWQENPQVTRTIRVRGKQKLAALHQAIYAAFDREDEHLYEFQVGGTRPGDPSSRSYVYQPAESLMSLALTRDEGDVQKAALGDLGLAVDQVFFYWFDFGDDWWHAITVLAIDPHAPPGKYPQITQRVGASPPQYFYEEEDWDGDPPEDA